MRLAYSPPPSCFLKAISTHLKNIIPSYRTYTSSHCIHRGQKRARTTTDRRWEESVEELLPIYASGGSIASSLSDSSSFSYCAPRELELDAPIRWLETSQKAVRKAPGRRHVDESVALARKGRMRDKWNGSALPSGVTEQRGPQARLSGYPTVCGPGDKSYMDKISLLHPAVHRDRTRTLERVEGAIQAAYGSNYRVEVFGSIRYGISLPKSDLDLVIIDPARPHGLGPGTHELPPIYKVRRLARVLGSAGFKGISPIPWATVPIVKFRDPVTGLECDINVNERLGLINSNMIKEYCDLSLDLQRMLAFIKSWSKPLGLNAPSPPAGSGPPSFSSYSFVLMTIGFLQNQGLLPNLQADLPPLPRGSLEGCFWMSTTSELCDTRFNTRTALDWKPPETKSLKDLMAQWFKFWPHGLDYQKHGICIREGGVIEKPELPSLSGLCVVDPFIQSKNVTRAVHGKSFGQFLQECDQASGMLENGADLDSLILSKGSRRH